MYVAGSSADKTEGGANATLAIGAVAAAGAAAFLVSGLLTVNTVTESEWGGGHAARRAASPQARSTNPQAHSLLPALSSVAPTGEFRSLSAYRELFAAEAPAL